jgi:probable HAF family extracellular repeat protein
MVDLGALGFLSFAAAVNKHGQVVGSSTTAGGETHAFSWTKKGGMLDLGTLGGTYSAAWAVNDHGQVVGTSTTARGEEHAFSWTKKGGMLDLGTLGGGFSTTSRVSNRGQVVGAATTAGPAFELHAFSWTNEGGMLDLGTLGGDSDAVAVNDRGQVVGVSNTTAGARATLWRPSSRHSENPPSRTGLLDELGLRDGGVTVVDAARAVGVGPVVRVERAARYAVRTVGGGARS